MADNSNREQRIHGTGLLLATFIGLAGWALAIFAYIKTGLPGVFVVAGVSVAAAVAAVYRGKD